MRQHLIVTVVSLTALFSACQLKEHRQEHRQVRNVIPVNLMQIASDTTTGFIEATGSISTQEETKLSFKTGGVIDRIYVQEGQYVKRGQLLATLQHTEIAAQVRQVQLAYQKAQRDYRRASNLYYDSVATLEQMQNAKTGADLALQHVQQVLFNQRHARIYAPANGFVISRLSNEGEVTGPGVPVLMIGSFAGGGQWVMQLSVSDRQWAAIRKGDEALVRIDAFGDRAFRGTVSKKALAADPATGSFGIEVQVDFGGVQPAIGLFGSARVRTSEKVVDYTIPYDALLEATGDRGYVFVSNNKTQVKKVPVKISRIGKDEVYISDGLQSYRYVVVSGSPYLKDNAFVKPMP